MTVAIVKSLQSEEQYDLFGISSFSRQMSLKLISLSYHESETCHVHVDLTMKNQLETFHQLIGILQLYSSTYFEAIDLIANYIQNKFDQPE